MSLNTAHAHGGVVVFNCERILIYYDGVEMALESSEQNYMFKGKHKGRIYLTTHRMVYTNKDPKDVLQSVSFPFLNLRGLELEQPVFGANYIKGHIKPEVGGGFTQEAKFKLWFNHGGAIEFGQALLQAGKMASRNRMPQPPAYSAATAPLYPAPPPAYSCPQGANYAFVPTATFPTSPPANSVYMSEAPPPYPGIDSSLPPLTPADGGKAAEAAAAGYYNPSAPNTVYAPPSHPPPAYSETKKYQ